MSEIPEIYLEISPRASGKTYRLLQAVNKWLNLSEYNIAFIYTPSGDRLKEISDYQKLIEEKNKKRVYINQFEWKSFSYFITIRQFWDEFDYNKDFYIGGTNNYHYYTTTAAYVRDLKKIDTKNDKIYKVLKNTNFKYVSYFPIHNINSYLEAFETDKVQDFYKLEFLNQFYRT